LEYAELFSGTREGSLWIMDNGAITRFDPLQGQFAGNTSAIFSMEIDLRAVLVFQVQGSLESGA
jgi:streptogramin lyase